MVGRGSGEAETQLRRLRCPAPASEIADQAVCGDATFGPSVETIASVERFDDLAETARGRSQPLGPGGAEDVVLLAARDGELRRVGSLGRAHFVRLHGRHGFP